MSADAITLADITTTDWSLMTDFTAGGGPGSGIGQVVQGIADIEQCLSIILTTPKGSDPLRPTFGADLWQYLDKPVNYATPALVREITESLLSWEPRITLNSVAVDLVTDEGDAQDGAHLEVTINWSLKLAGATAPPQSTTINVPSPS